MAKMYRMNAIMVDGVEDGKEFNHIDINFRNGGYHTMWFRKNGKVVFRKCHIESDFEYLLKKWSTHENAEICFSVSTIEV